MWCGGNFIFRTNFIQYCEFAVALHIYDKLFLRRSSEVDNAIGVPDAVVGFVGPTIHGLDRGIF
jgi:hypothetical protein